jgi:putative MFS transporter
MFMGLGLLGPSIGSMLVAPFVDGWERRKTLACLSISTLLAIAAFVFSGEPALLVAGYFAFGVFAALLTPTITLYVAELFTTSERARASSHAWTMNRVASAVAPLVLVPVVRANGPATAFLVLALVGGVTIAVLASAPAGQQRRAVG